MAGTALQHVDTPPGGSPADPIADSLAAPIAASIADPLDALVGAVRRVIGIRTDWGRTAASSYTREFVYQRRSTTMIKRMDNVLVVVDDLAAVIAFFVELGMELEGRTTVEGESVDQLVGLDGVRADIAMLRTPDGHGRVELTRFHTPTAISAEPKDAPLNTLGIRRMMFAVDDIEEVVARLRNHGAELVGELVRYENSYRLCNVRGPEGIVVALAEQLG
ncbi:VOC family protein [Micromonospora sp. WMMD1102]|uniref:VOC family protein n=1 Tax=Micromonospora sp. WMMD1102 TaxID=3016105 RepID=UPI0024152D60|nr:VOC family protein [Micromonospora sp. WMMD1102]MDG4785305.1 VOC family protein [Micromonospora sp. WMMD1102]